MEIGLLQFGKSRLERYSINYLGIREQLQGLIYILGESAAGLFSVRVLVYQAGDHITPGRSWPGLVSNFEQPLTVQRTDHPDWIKRYESVIGRVGRSGFLVT